MQQVLKEFISYIQLLELDSDVIIALICLMP